MGSLTTKHRYPQFRCLPVTGGKTPIHLLYVANLQGKWESINHSFVDWSVGDFSQRMREVHHEQRDDH
ncbi:hypothetical protein [Gibbsiella quercinecans]|uniref:hypothetical protein n=1 Tax=Gibbsiella quercinecans TaxID=929813 RepID=UPI0016011802|nr:hypothetical protein [Gibbsiella quercinecans]